MTHPYDDLAGFLRSALGEVQRLGLGPSLSKGRVGEVLLAHHLGHQLQITQQGADGIGDDGRKYEYKVSHDDQFNFNFGHARGEGEAANLVDKHFSDLTGAYCALMHGETIVKLVYCPCIILVPYLRTHLTSIKVGKTFQKVFSPIESFGRLADAAWLVGEPSPTKRSSGRSKTRAA